MQRLNIDLDFVLNTCAIAVYCSYFPIDLVIRKIMSDFRFFYDVILVVVVEKLIFLMIKVSYLLSFYHFSFRIWFWWLYVPNHEHEKRSDAFTFQVGSSSCFMTILLGWYFRDSLIWDETLPYPTYFTNYYIYITRFVDCLKNTAQF